MRAPLFAALALLAVSSGASAQITANATATTNLKVVSGISIQNNANVDFGNIAQGQGTVTLSKNGGLSSSSGITSQTAGSAGKFTVSGFPTAAFSITASATALSAGSGAPAINFAPVVYGYESDNPSAAVGVNSGILNSSGNFYLYIGGQVTVPVNQPQGTYAGSVTVTVNYTAV